MLNVDQISNIELCWDEFDDWCRENEVDMDDEGERDGIWWSCWSTAIMAKIEAIQEKEKESLPLMSNLMGPPA